MEDNKYIENEYNIQSPNGRNQNNVNRERYSPNPMYKSMKIYGNNYNNNDLDNYGDTRRKNYEYNNYYNGNRKNQMINDNYY